MDGRRNGLGNVDQCAGGRDIVVFGASPFLATIAKSHCSLTDESSCRLSRGDGHGAWPDKSGGALLAILASGINTRKEAIRYTVAHYYLVFSTIQMIVLGTVMERHTALLANLPMAGISASVYLLAGTEYSRGQATSHTIWR